MNQRKKNSCKK